MALLQSNLTLCNCLGVFLPSVQRVLAVASSLSPTPGSQLLSPFSESLRGATKKAGGSIKNSKDSHPKYLGSKVSHGQVVFPGRIIMKQRGTQWYPGHNVGMGKDHTIFSKTVGHVQFRQEVRGNREGGFMTKQIIDVTPINNDYSAKYSDTVASMVARRALVKAQLSHKVPRASGLPLSIS